MSLSTDQCSICFAIGCACIVCLQRNCRYRPSFGGCALRCPGEPKNYNHFTCFRGYCKVTVGYNANPGVPRMKSASSIPEFFEWVELIADTFTAADGFEAAWFRGVSSAKYKLIPSLYRSQAGRDEYSDDELRAEFQRRGLPFVAERPPRDHWEWYFLMQHYGAPTRRLDWADSALVALYFAISSMRATDADIAASKPVVWALNPWKLNTNRFYGPASPNIDDLKNYLSDDYKSHKPPRYPVANDPNFIAQRMVVQRSHFTLHGHDLRGLDEMKAELGRVYTQRKASTMSANERKPRKRTSSFSNREKIRRKPLSLRNSRSISFRFL